MKNDVDAVLINSLEAHQFSKQEMEEKIAEIRKKRNVPRMIVSILIIAEIIGLIGSVFLLIYLSKKYTPDDTAIYFFCALTCAMALMVTAIIFRDVVIRVFPEYGICYRYYFGEYLLSDEAADLVFSENFKATYNWEIRPDNSDYLELSARHSSTNGYITGMYQGIPFLSDTLLVNEEAERQYKTVFYGQEMFFRVPKPFPADIHFIQKGFEIAKTDSPFSKLQKAKKEGQTNTHNVTLGDEEFRKVFRCRCNQEGAEASALASALSNALLALEKELKGKVLVSIQGSKVHVMIDDKTPLGTMLRYPRGIMDPTYSEKKFQQNAEKFRKEFNAVFSFIDKLMSMYG